jgi:hypothetical protein
MNTQPTPETDESTLKATNMEDIKAYKQFLKETNADLKRERDEWKAKYIQQNKDLGCELRDPNGTIWDHAKTLQRELAEAREYADKLAEGLPDGMLPKDVEVLREANLGLATELATVTAQRDRLAKALHKVSRSWNYVEVAQQALQSLTPNAEL